jgi:hypothetical protein
MFSARWNGCLVVGKSSLALVVGLLLVWVNGAAAQQAKGRAENAPQFPSELRNSWCSVNYSGERVVIAVATLEEGDGLCTAKKIQKGEWGNQANFEITLTCESGVEGKKPKLVVERFTPFKLNGSPALLRAGGMYNPKLLHLYQTCPAS